MLHAPRSTLYASLAFFKKCGARPPASKPICCALALGARADATRMAAAPESLPTHSSAIREEENSAAHAVDTGGILPLWLVTYHLDHDR